MFENVDSNMGVILFAADSKLRRTFISAVVDTCITGVKKVNGRLIRFSMLGKELETADGSERIKQSILSLSGLDYFMIDEAFRGRRNFGGTDSLSFEVRSSDELCGRLSFYNILNNTLEGAETMEKKDFFSAAVLLDADRILDGDISDQGYFMESIARIRKLYAYIHIYVAIGRTELYFRGRNTTDTTGLIEAAKKAYSRFFEYLDRCAEGGENDGGDTVNIMLRYEVSAYSAANKDYEKVFDEYGGLLENPIYSPWGIDDILIGMIYSSSSVLQSIMDDNTEECKKILKTRSGIFNRHDPRAVLDTQRARRVLSKMLVERYPMVNANKYFKP